MTEINEIQKTTEEEIKTKPPFEIGEFVMMRSCSLKLVRFSNYPKNDIGVVTDIKERPSFWLITVYWQKYKPKKGYFPVIKHTRLKKLRIKKNAK